MFPARSKKPRPFLINASGFTLGQLLASLTIISVAAFFIATVYSALAIFAHSETRHASCASNIKQLGLSFLQYSQDYDEKYPPCAVSTADDRVLLGWAATHNRQGSGSLVKQATYGQLIGGYIKSGEIFYCPQAPEQYGPVSYMYNDLASSVAQKDVAAPDKTVLICDGESFAGNVGHAYDPNSPASPAAFAADGAVILGATLQAAPLRHSDGANYGYADGHVKWCKPKSIFFPSRGNAIRSHKDAKTGKLLGPDPARLNAEQADRHDGIAYVGTFHIK